MGVYLQMDSFSPVPNSYYYDFRNKSREIIEAKGWHNREWSPSFDADGMYYNTWACGYDLLLWDSGTVFNNAKKIKLVCDFKITNSSKRWLSLQVSGASGWSSDFWFFVNHSHYEYRFNWSTSSTTSSSWWSGVKISTIVYDLVNKTYTYSWVTSKAGSLTDAQITALKNCNYILITVADWWVRLSDITLQAE